MKKKILTLCTIAFTATTALASSGEAASSGDTNITHHMMMLMIQLGVIIFAAKFGGLLFQRLKMPSVLGELCAGMLIGPYLLGNLAFPGFAKGLFPPTGGPFPISVELYGICSLAAIILLFLVGLESDLKLFLRFSVAGTVVGIGGVITSFVLGDLTMLAVDDLVFGKNLGFFDGPCLFLGVLSTATSVGITARILSEKRKLSSPEGVTILAGAVIDDVLGIIMLAVVLGAISASKATGVIDWGHIGIIAGKAIGIWLISTILGLIFARRISVLLKWFKDQVSIAIMALGLALILAGLFEEAGLAMIIGAYVAGLSLSQTDISRVIQDKLDPVQKLLVPIFFCCMGMLVNFQALGSIKIILFGLLYSLIAILAKVLGCSLPALFFKFNLRGALRIGMGMVPRGEVALIMAGIGLAWGVLGPQEFGVAIMMTVITTLIAPIFLVMLINNPGSGTTTEISTGERSTFTFRFPSEEVTELMYTKLLAAFETDGFFVHALEHDDQDIYQLRQNDMVIELRHGTHDIYFDCDQNDEHIVNSAVYEVSTELRRMLSGLNKPIDQSGIQKKMQRSAKTQQKTKLNLTQYIPEDCIEPSLKGITKNEIIAELLDLLIKRNHVTEADRNKIYNALLEREKVISTGMQNGFALPHIKTGAVDRIICAVGIKAEGVDFNALDDQPSRIFILELAPKNATGPHLQFVSTVTQTIQTLGNAILARNIGAREIHRMLTH